MDEPLSAELEALERLRREQAFRAAELGGVKYAIFTVRQEIAGHMLYPQTDKVRHEIAKHHRHLVELTRQEAVLSQRLAEISDRIRTIRTTIDLQH
jgi:hypothetical protein